ncbi:TPA: hypothetical protein IXT79_001085 [Enterococcus faecium]|uniref:hypothetical protein n=1 Tax=Enterococcus faecium TaxID=1352 RepID=UPI000B3EBED6|nr:hypothetical protein [Enterococcus faecium]OUZ28909.1 hypothetical protein A5806_001647 [Enterococcus faecium]HAQ5019886.1 hypothetical protein [Enterococcus faecium]
MYEFNDALFLLNHSISLKTLKNWCIKIEKMTDTKFQRRYTKNRNGRKYSYKVFNSSQLAQLKQLSDLRTENKPLDEAIYEIFMSEEGKRKQEEIALSKLEFEENKADTKKLIELTKKALQENADLKKRIIRLEKSANVETSNR